MLENSWGGCVKKRPESCFKQQIPTDSELQNQWEKLKGRDRGGPPHKHAAASTTQLSCSLHCNGLFYMLVLGAVYSKAENTVI